MFSSKLVGGFRQFSTASGKAVLVIGGNGALGQSVVNVFNKGGWYTVSSDIAQSSSAGKSIMLKPGPLEAQLSQLHGELDKNVKFDVVVCAAGGWVGGNAEDMDQFVQGMHQMTDMCLNPALMACNIAANKLNNTGLLVLTGAAAALNPTPGMLAYGVVKAATHHLVRSMAAKGSGLPFDAKVVGVLPKILDTPSNRKFMAEGTDTSSWTPTDDVAEAVLKWVNDKDACKSGQLLEAVTADGKTSWTIHP